MESQVSQKNIEARVEAMAATENKTPEVKAPEVKAPEVKAPETTPEVKAPEVKAPEVKASEVKAPEVKAPETKVEKKQPNDAAELRKWATKASQESAALREEVKALKAAIEKSAKKPVDYAAISKDPEALKKHIEAERAEAAAEFQEQLVAERNERVKNQTVVERMKREQDKENYPRWEKLFPLIQTLAANGDGRVNWNQHPGIALDEAYALAETLSPAEIAAAAAAPAPAPIVPPAPVVTEDQIQARITAAVEAAVAKAKADSEAGIRAEQNGGGVGSKGNGGRRDSKVSLEAMKTMPLKDLKKVISQE